MKFEWLFLANELKTLAEAEAFRCQARKFSVHSEGRRIFLFLRSDWSAPMVIGGNKIKTFFPLSFLFHHTSLASIKDTQA
jgi:hypothetical protein